MAIGFAIHNSMTDHGGMIPATQMRASQMGNLFLLADDGHFCPKCKCWSKIIKSHDHIVFYGKSVAYAGDKLTCGAKILPKQSHVVGDSARNSGRASVIKLESSKVESSPMNSFVKQDSKSPPHVFSPDGGRVDVDGLRGMLNTVTFGLSEKVFTTAGMEPADPKRLAIGEKAVTAAATVIGPGKIRVAAEGVGVAGKTAYEIAKNGGKHASTYKKYLDVSSKEIQKGIRSLEKQIQEHSDLIKNPIETMKKLGKGDWKSLDPRQQKALLEKKWPGDIKRQEETINIFKGILKERGE